MPYSAIAVRSKGGLGAEDRLGRHRGEAQRSGSGVTCPLPGLPTGSHDTMTYCLDRKSPISSKEPRLLQLLCKVLPCVALPVVLRWSTTQVRVCGHARAGPAPAAGVTRGAVPSSLLGKRD